MIRALAQATAVLMTVALIAFSMFRYVGDPVANMAGPETTKEELNELRERLGLNDPLPVQFGRFPAEFSELGWWDRDRTLPADHLSSGHTVRFVCLLLLF